MKTQLLLATRNGLAFAEHDGSAWIDTSTALEGRHITSLTARHTDILAGTTDGIFLSEDRGASWQEMNNGLEHRHVRWLARHPEHEGLIIVGAEPASIFFSRDGGQSWTARPEVAELRDRHGWQIPYSPEAGCVRGLAFHGQRLYAAAEVGGVLRSDDTGESWGLAAGSTGESAFRRPPPDFVHSDVHDVAVHPTDPDLVFASTGGGLYRSRDGGATWQLLYDCYCRSLWLDPQDPDHVIFGPADYVGSYGRIEETSDGGQTWRMISEHLNTPWPHTMPERFAQISGELFCVLDDGRLLVTPADAADWHFVLGEIESINAIAGQSN
jgi:photosystem II stability/assembly factor-like uncharacterized protein